jgi:outer membrane protein assembly factor BamB
LVTCCGAPAARPDDAREILDASGIQGGLIVHVGCGDAELTADLGVDGRFLVEGLDPDAGRVEKAGRRVEALGLCRSVSVKHWPHDVLPYADHLVNLVVSEELGAIPMKEVLRVLVPGGVAYINTDGRWVKTVKPPPEGMDEWTHWLHGPDNNPVAEDTRVGPPRSVQWIASPVWPKSHDAAPSMTGLVSAGGKIFYIADDGPAGIKHPQHDLERWCLFARDAFNGLLLWKTPIEDWGARAWSPDDYPYLFGPWTVNPRMIHRRLVAVGDRVYVTLGFGAPVSMLDAATGTVLKTFSDTEFASEVLVDEGRLLAIVDRAAGKAGRYTHAPRKSVVAVDLESGNTIWEKVGLAGIEDLRRRGLDAKLTRLFLTAGGGKVFLLEDSDVVALDAATGRERWRIPRPEKISHRNPKDVHPVNDPYDLGSMLYADDVLYVWQPHLPPTRARFWQYRMELLAVSAADGKTLWKTTCGGAGFASFASVFKAQGLVWVQSAPEYVERKVEETYDLLGLDPQTGQVVKRHPVQRILQGGIHHHRCYQNKATERYVMYSRNGVDFVDLEGGQINVNKWVRGICQYGVMPANGLLYAPPQPCACFPSARLSGYHAFSADADTPNHAIEAPRRLEKGPAYGQAVASGATTADDWSTYRHDSLRSGATATEVPSQLDRLWSTEFHEPITAPTVALGKVFVATRHSRRVCAVDKKDGTESWSFRAGNRVDSPPTIADGRAYFGTADGHVYCLRASDGALVWRFDANPRLRHVLRYGNVESAWPVHGSVVVKDGAVYFAAGRSSYLDGGLWFYVLDAVSGEAIRSARYCSIGDEQEIVEKRARGTFNDVLVCDGQSLFLKNVAVDLDTLERNVFGWSYIPVGKTWPGSPLSAVGGFLDESLFDRVGWVLDYHVIAKMLVFNDGVAFGTNWRERPTFWHGNMYHTGTSSHMVFARRRVRKTTKDPSENACTVEEDWATPVPARVTAMTLTGSVLFFAGPSWKDDSEGVANLLDRSGPGVLGAVDPATGRQLATYPLEAAPVWDGMAAASGRLYLATKDGRLLCLGRKQ